MRVFNILLFFFLGLTVVSAQLSGIVMNEKGKPLIGATIFLLPDSLYTISKGDGHFYFDKIKNGNYKIITSYIGYESSTHEFEWDKETSDIVTITLRRDNKVLETVVVTDEHMKQEETLQTEHIHEDFFKKNIEGTFSQSIEKLAGISSINVGVGIAKPVIRGLSSNRIIVNHQGIKQESQQWGSDHGLEIDQFDVSRVEIVKGPGSLQYGSDGLGGVINIMPDRLLPFNTYMGNFQTIYKTNNNHWGGSGKIGFNKNNYFLTLRYSYQDFADYHVPSNSFEYNDFVLPIVNNRLKNTAGKESNITINAGVSKDWGLTRIHYSHYSLKAGLFSGAVGIPRSYALSHDGNYRDIDVPSQKVDHQKISLNQTFLFGTNHFVIDLGFQRNHRRELSEPEFHSIPLSELKDANNKLAIELLLETFSVSSHYEQHLFHQWKHTIGGNAQWQKNTKGGFEHLLPNFRTFRGGIFSIVEKELNEKFIMNGGLRLDLGHNQTDYYRQYVWNSNEVITDSLISPLTNNRFYNWSASIGSNYTFSDKKWTLKSNLGKSFRVPYPSETVSNGVHHGTFRHELGTPDLISEHGYQLDVGVYFNYNNIEGSIAGYFNYFDNYIYLGPAFPAMFSKLPEAGQIYQYRQDDAIYTGFEIEYNWSINKNIELEQAIDFVQSHNLRTHLALPFTPQPSVRNGLTYSLKDGHRLKESFVKLSHEYHFAAVGIHRIDRSEKSTPAYQLWDLGLGTSVHLKNVEIDFSIQVKNVFDTKYFNHLSRYRIINVPEQGRNVVFVLRVPIAGKI